MLRPMFICTSFMGLRNRFFFWNPISQPYCTGMSIPRCHCRSTPGHVSACRICTREQHTYSAGLLPSQGYPETATRSCCTPMCPRTLSSSSSRRLASGNRKQNELSTRLSVFIGVIMLKFANIQIFKY